MSTRGKTAGLSAILQCRWWTAGGVPTTSSLALSPHHLLCDVVFILDCEYNYA